MELDAIETMEEDARGSGYTQAGSIELVDNARAGCQVGPMIVETDYGSYHQGYAINDGKKA